MRLVEVRASRGRDAFHVTIVAKTFGGVVRQYGGYGKDVSAAFEEAAGSAVHHYDAKALAAKARQEVAAQAALHSPALPPDEGEYTEHFGDAEDNPQA
jgi:hypothetical protein